MSERATRRRALELLAATAGLIGEGRRVLAQAAIDGVPDPDEDPLLARALQPWTGDLDGMIERGMIRFAVPYGLSTYFIDRADQRGVTYDNIVQFEAVLRKSRGATAAKLAIVILPTRLDRLIPMVTSGVADIAAGGLTATDARSAVVDFSEPFRTDVRELVVSGPAAPPIATLDDLARTTVYLDRSSSFFEHTEALNAEREAAGRPRIPLAEADRNLTQDDVLEMVATGIFPASIADESVTDLLGQVFDGLRIHNDLAVATGQRIVWMFRKESPKLEAEVNRFVAEARKGTSFGNQVLAKYLRSQKWIEDATSEQGRGRFKEVTELIKAYAARYDFDWLMIAAQGYQESRLDQSKRSPAGAVGIMQVMPATARDPNVGIPDIEKAEHNVHAGVKYLRFLRDRYYTDPALSPLDQTLLSFAAYNAGPGNVAKARKHAGKVGLDPNVWLDNVEIAAGKVVSREPVVYVRNIYKYYVAYKLIAGQRAVAN